MNRELIERAVGQAAGDLERGDETGQRVLRSLWEAAYEQGRLDALDEFSGRFCVCMK